MCWTGAPAKGIGPRRHCGEHWFSKGKIDGQRTGSIEQGKAQAESQSEEGQQGAGPSVQGLSSSERKPMQIEGSIRANLIAAIASAKRLRGHPVHSDTIKYWRQLLDYARRVSTQPQAEVFGDLMVELETELTHSK